MLSVVIAATDNEQRAVLQVLVDGTGVARTVHTCPTFPVEASDPVMRRVRATNPDVLLVDIPSDSPAIAMRAIELLRLELPDSAVFAIGSLNQPQVVVSAMRASAREFIERPTTTDDLLEAFPRLTTAQRRVQKEGQRGKVFSIVNAKGGSGATTVAVNLALALQAVPSKSTRGLRARRPAELGLITLDTKQAGKPSAGKQHAGFDAAGAGNQLTVRIMRHSQRKRRDPARLNLRSMAPVLDPTAQAACGQVSSVQSTQELLKDGNKSDRIDARKLAELLYLDDLKSVYHGETGVRMLRELSDPGQRSDASHESAESAVSQLGDSVRGTGCLLHRPSSRMV